MLRTQNSQKTQLSLLMPAVQIVRRSSVSDPEFESDNLVDLWSKDALAMFWTIIQLFDGATVKNRGRKAERLSR